MKRVGRPKNRPRPRAAARILRGRLYKETGTRTSDMGEVCEMAGRQRGGCWLPGKGGVGWGEGGWPAEDDGGRLAVGNRRRMMGGVLRPQTSMGNGELGREKAGWGGNSLAAAAPQMTSARPPGATKTTATSSHTSQSWPPPLWRSKPVPPSSFVRSVRAPVGTAITRRRQRRWCCCRTGGSPSHLHRLRCHVPTILRPFPAFEAVIGKRRAGSISRLREAFAAVLVGVVVVSPVVVNAAVFVERRCGEMRVSESKVVE